MSEAQSCFYSEDLLGNFLFGKCLFKCILVPLGILYCCALSDEVKLFNIVKKVHLFYISLWWGFSCGASLVQICGGNDDESDISHQQYIRRTNQICGFIWKGSNKGELMKGACWCCTREPALRGTVRHTAETDRLTGKLDFKASHQEGQVHSVYSTAAGVLIMIAAPLNTWCFKLANTWLRRKLVYTHTVCLHTHSETRMRI